VTSRIVSEKAKMDFGKAAADCGLGSDDAAAILFRAELEERWISEALRS
jgi:hypothetical protein